MKHDVLFFVFLAALVLAIPFWLIGRNVRQLWRDTPKHERQPWIIVLIALMTLLGGLAGAGHVPYGRVVHPHLHAE